MQCSKNKLSDKAYKIEERKMIIILISMFIIIPFALKSKFLIPILLGYSFLIFRQALVFKRNFVPLIIALSLTAPGFLDNMGNDAKFLLYFLRLIILVIWFSYYFLLYKGKNGIKGIASIMMLFLGEFYSLITGNNQEFLSVLYAVIYLSMMHFISSKDNMRTSSVFKYFDVIFICTGIYGILESFCGICPYEYDLNFAVFRASGLLGHPLVLAIVTLLYQVMLYVRYIYTKNFNFLLYFFSILVAMITVSRTVYIVYAVLLLYFLIVTKYFVRFKRIVALIAAAALIGAGVIYFFPDLYEGIVYRFVNGEAYHREAAFATVEKLFRDKPFGVGIWQIDNVIATQGYATWGFIVGFGTLDNFFLTQIAAYGYFSIVAFYFYFQYYFHFLKNLQALKLLCFLFLIWFSISFSFDLESYPAVLIIFGFYSTFLVKKEFLGCKNVKAK